jgi:hypothetical protein
MNASGSVDLIRVARKNKSLRYGIAHVELHPSTVGCQCRASQQIRELYQRRPPLGSRFGASVANSQPTTSEWYSGYFLRLTASKFAGQPSDLRILSRGREDASRRFGLQRLATLLFYRFAACSGASFHRVPRRLRGIVTWPVLQFSVTTSGNTNTPPPMASH